MTAANEVAKRTGEPAQRTASAIDAAKAADRHSVSGSPASPTVAAATQVSRERKSVAVASSHFEPPPLLELDRDSFASTALSDVIDRSLAAATARFTAGMSPAALGEAWVD